MHPGELVVEADAVQSLIAAQFPQWRQLPVRRLDSDGTVCAIFRVGDRLSARFPLVPQDLPGSHQTLRAEMAAGRLLAKATRFPTPEPVAVGEPGEGYPSPWLIQTWIPGTTAVADDPGHRAAFAADLAEFITAVRAVHTHGRRFQGPGRGGVIGDHEAWMAECFDKSADLLDVDPLRALWARMRRLPRGNSPDVMCHGDLMPGNVLVARGHLGGVLDCGGLGPADPALDLTSAWHLLERGPRAVLRSALGTDDDEWARGRAWAFEQAMGLVWYYATSNPVMSAIGRRTLQRIVADEEAHAPTA